MANNRLFGTESKNKVIETEELVIRGHLLLWNDTAIQISNISMLSTAPLSAPPFPIISILLILGGLVAIAISDSQIALILLGIALLAVGIVLIVLWSSACRRNEEKMYLNLSLNSGVGYSFLFNDKVFLRRVWRVPKRQANSEQGKDSLKKRKMPLQAF